MTHLQGFCFHFYIYISSHNLWFLFFPLHTSFFLSLCICSLGRRFLEDWKEEEGRIAHLCGLAYTPFTFICAFCCLPFCSFPALCICVGGSSSLPSLLSSPTLSYCLSLSPSFFSPSLFSLPHTSVWHGRHGRHGTWEFCPGIFMLHGGWGWFWTASSLCFLCYFTTFTHGGGTFNMCLRRRLQGFGHTSLAPYLLCLCYLSTTARHLLCEVRQAGQWSNSFSACLPAWQA